VETLTPAARLQQQREALEWAEDLLRQQPAELRQAYQQTGESVAAALTQPTYSFVLRLPDRIMLKASEHSITNHTWHIGTFINRMRRVPCHNAILATLKSLSFQSQSDLAQCVRLVEYIAAREILMRHVPDLDQPLQTIDGQAETRVNQLSQYIQWLHTVEALYPGWTSADLYNEKYGQLVDLLTDQGRALAHQYTGDLIREVQESSRGGLRGLTLFIPYLDEQLYRMTTYEVVVIPRSRIPYRPQFVVSACRIAQQEVRKNPRLSQSTRWQLVLQLDRVIQAFEARHASDS
jgi:hypothetical protein